MNPGIENFKESMRRRVQRKVQSVMNKAAEQMKYIDSLPEADEIGSEDDRIWLDQFAKGYGFDICCGDFLIGDTFQAVGIDGNKQVLGIDFLTEGDNLHFQEDNSLDYIVTNYFDVFPTPLEVLTEWYRVLKPNGILAIVCRDADKFDDPLGPLANWKRQSVYTEKTLKNYLYRVKFRDVLVGKGKTSIRSTAFK